MKIIVYEYLCIKKDACHVEVKVADDASFEGCTEVLLQVMRKGQDRANKLSARDYAT